MNADATPAGDEAPVRIRYQAAVVPYAQVLRFLLVEERRNTWFGALATLALALLLYAAGVEAWIVWIALAALVLVALTTAVMVWQLRQRIRQLQTLFGTSPVDMTVDAHGLAARTALGEASVRWKGVKEVRRRPAFWLIRFAANEDLTIVPAAAVTPEFLSAFERHARAAGVRLLDK